MNPLPVVESAQSSSAIAGHSATPFGANWQKMMMWVFIVTDALLFAGFLGGYGFVRLASLSWPDRSRVFNLRLIALMTFVLISSSATMASAVAAARRSDRRMLVRFLLFTVLGGLCFLSLQAYEWTNLIREGATLHSNPWGVPLFTACFFLITGFHGSHVLTGLIILAITTLRSARGRSTSNGVEVAGLYWHFVDLVWVFIFTFFI
jgi:cytochrome c oxidase subunit III